MDPARVNVPLVASCRTLILPVASIGSPPQPKPILPFGETFVGAPPTLGLDAPVSVSIPAGESEYTRIVFPEATNT